MRGKGRLQRETGMGCAADAARTAERAETVSLRLPHVVAAIVQKNRREYPSTRQESMMRRIIRYLWTNFELCVANAALALLVWMLFIQVVARYVFHAGLAWTEEVSRFSFIYFVYVSASLAVFRGTHIKVEVVVNLLPEKIRHGITALATVIQVVFCLVAGIAGARLVLDMIDFPTLSPALLLPLYYVYFIIPFSYFLMAIRLIQRNLFLCRKSV